MAESVIKGVEATEAIKRICRVPRRLALYYLLRFAAKKLDSGNKKSIHKC
jgi:hypothetical protein